MNQTTLHFVLKYLSCIIFIVSVVGALSTSCEFEDIAYQQPVPVAMEASEVTSSGFFASWNPIEGVESYTILVSTDTELNETSNVEGYPTNSRTTNFWVGNLEANQTYYYRVKVSRNEDENEYSNVIPVTTLPLAPPQVITPDQVTPLSFTARWQSVPEAEGYLLYVSTSANFTKHLPNYNGIMVSDTTALVEDLNINQDYFYRVRTVRGKSISQPSDLVRVSTSRLAKPVLLDASEISFTSITINWEAVAGATSYHVFVGTDRFVITDILPDYNPRIVTDATSLVVLGLNANTSYYYRIQAVNEASASENSDVGSVSTVSLAAPTVRTATDIQIDGFQANWDSVTNASSYVLDISRNENFTDLLNGYRAKEVVDTFEVVTGLLRNTVYYYRVRSKGFGAVSDNSEAMTVRTTFFASPKAREAIELQPTSFRAVWQPVEAADSYRLDVASDANFDNILSGYNNLAITDTTQLVTGLTENKRYFYRIRALKGSVFSGYSNIIDLTTTRLSEPQLLATINIELTSFTIRWQTVSGALRYRVDVGLDPAVTNKIATDYDNREVNGTSLDVVGLDANTVYYFKVRAENNVSTGGSSLGSAKTASINPPVAGDPTDLQLTSFQANWSAVANAESYLLDVAIDASFNNLVAGFNAREIFDVLEVVTGLQPDKIYHYRVRAKGLGSTSDYSDVKTATTPPLPPPVVEAATDREVYQFTANWLEADGADRYLLYVATDPLFGPTDILSAYDGIEVLGNSYVVTNLDPYTTYYYQLKSKQGATTSDVSEDFTTVAACISDNCRLLRRTFEDWREETYRYNSGGRVDQIELNDISSGSSLLRRSQITYSGENIFSVTEINSSTDDRFWKFAYENYGAGQQRIKNIIIEQMPLTSDIVKISFTYSGTGSGRPASMIQQNGVVNPTDTTFTLVSEENYAYGANGISVSDGTGDLIKETILGADFNTASLLSSDLALLLFNPTNPNSFLLPHIPERDIEYYQYRDDTVSPWNNYPYSYEYNTKRVPKSVRATNGIPKLVYQLSGCNF